jgi:transglutaminase-like putative cysteine protease
VSPVVYFRNFPTAFHTHTGKMTLVRQIPKTVLLDPPDTGSTIFTYKRSALEEGQKGSKMIKTRLMITALILLFVSCSKSGDVRDYYSVSQYGRTLGWLAVDWTEPAPGSNDPITVDTEMQARISMLEQPVDIRSTEHIEIDPFSDDVTRSSRRTITGEIDIETSWFVDGDSIRIAPPRGGNEVVLALPPDVRLESGVSYASLLRELHPTDKSHISDRIIDAVNGRFLERDVEWVRTDTLRVLERDVPCALIEFTIPGLGARSRVWVESATGRLVRLVAGDGTTISRTDPAVRRRAERVAFDNQFTIDVDAQIEDPHRIRRMSVRAVLHSVGSRLDSASLNLPGQAFTGTVTFNRIDGVFDIAHPRYDGDGAPPFPPPDWSAQPGLQTYLAPEPFLESDDPAITAMAAELTEGSEDCWEATRRLAKWVSDEIGYEIPGGGTARRTFELRKGECGSHARLMAAMCRAVGIPARMVTGAMYFVMDHGKFGQHGWNEIYMGESARWITLDTTIDEVDYVDSGHIRLGEACTFEPVSMEIVEYELEADSTAAK